MGQNILQGKKGIIFGALDELSIAWQVAERVVEEGAEIILTNAPVALRMGKIKDLASKLNCEVVAADATNMDDLNLLMDKAEEKFGKIDFILHSIGMSPNVRKKKEYTGTNYDFFHKTLDISGLSFHRVMQIAYQRDIINEWGSVVALSYIAAQRTFFKYNDMAEAKSLLESIARSFGYHYGKAKKVRVNTISQSPTPTTAGTGIKDFDKMFKFGELNSPLGNATTAACADYCISLFSDLTRYVTMQNLFHDGGFSNVGISQEVLDLVEILDEEA